MEDLVTIRNKLSISLFHGSFTYTKKIGILDPIKKKFMFHNFRMKFPNKWILLVYKL